MNRLQQKDFKRQDFGYDSKLPNYFNKIFNIILVAKKMIFPKKISKISLCFKINF